MGAQGGGKGDHGTQKGEGRFLRENKSSQYDFIMFKEKKKGGIQMTSFFKCCSAGKVKLITVLSTDSRQF